VPKGGGTHSLAGEAVGGPNSDEGTEVCNVALPFSMDPKSSLTSGFFTSILNFYENFGFIL